MGLISLQPLLSPFPLTLVSFHHPARSSFSPLHIFPTEYSCHCSSNTSALLTWWVFPVCAKVQHTITLSDFLFVICLVVIVQRRILPSLPHDEELSRWSYHWFILPALSVWLMALYSQANPSSNCTVTDSLGFINEANIFRTIESPSQNTLIESSVSFDFLFF